MNDLRTRLAVVPPLALPLAALAALVALLLGIGHWAEQRELASRTDALRHTLEVHALGLRGAAERFDYLPATSGRHPAIAGLLAHPRDAALLRQVDDYLEQLNAQVGALALYLLDERGLTLASSNWAQRDSFVGQNYQHRPYFEQALAGERSVFYGVGLTTGVPGLFIAEPVKRGSDIVGVMVVKVGLDAIQAAWSGSPDPVVLSDARGIVFLSSVPEWMYGSRRVLGDEDRAWLAKYRQYGPADRPYPPLPWKGAGPSPPSPADPSMPYRVSARIHGLQRDFLVLDTRLPRLGWTLSVMADLRQVDQARRVAEALSGLVAGLLLMGVLYWRLRERRRTEQRQRAQEAQLQHAARLASLGEMASTLAHELNQPLMALSNYAAAARRFAERGPSDLLLQTVDEMQAQARRAADIVSGIRGFVRQRSAGPEACEVADIVASVRTLLGPEIEARRVRVEVEIAPGLPAVRVDRLLVEQLLVNLVMNALQAMGEQPAERRRLRFDAAAEGREVRIAITDWGPGIPADVAGRLFEAFFSTKADGLGLGLKICRSIAERQGGRLFFQAAPHGGATFVFTLPSAP